jgi:hypothetical protein
MVFKRTKSFGVMANTRSVCTQSESEASKIRSVTRASSKGSGGNGCVRDGLEGRNTVHVSTGTAMSSGVTKDTRGEAVSSDGSTEMAIPSMAVTVQSHGKEDSEAERLGSGIEAKVINDGKPCDVEITSRCDANGMGDSDWVIKSGYGQQVWYTIRGDKYRIAMVFILNIFRVARVKEETLNIWIGGLKEGVMRSRLHGWLLWAEFCRTKGISISAIQEERNPAVMMADFVCFMYLEGASNTWRVVGCFEK